MTGRAQGPGDYSDLADPVDVPGAPARQGAQERDVVLTGVWPVLDVADLAHPERLLAEAADDLPRLAAQLRAELTGAPPRMSIRPGREVPGSGGAQWVVHALVPARRKPPRRFYGQATG